MAVCVALDVGLVVETDEFVDAVHWAEDMAWLDAAHGFSRMSGRDARVRVRDMAAALFLANFALESRGVCFVCPEVLLQVA